MANYNNEWLVINNGDRLEIYDISKEEIDFLKTHRLEKWAYSVCTIEDTLFIHNKRLLKQGEKVDDGANLNMLHAYSLPDLEQLFSFGQSYKSSSPMIVNRLSSGNISCNTSSSTVVFSSEEMPILHGYSAQDGQMRWKRYIKGLTLLTWWNLKKAKA